MKKTTLMKQKLLGTTCVMALGMAAGMAAAQEVDATNGNYTIGVSQTLDAFESETVTVQSDVEGEQVSTNTVEAVTDSTLTVGGPLGGNRVSSSLTGNLAETTLRSDVNNDVIGSATAFVDSGATVTGTDPAKADSYAVDANLAAVVSQNVNSTDADVGSASTIGSFTSNVETSSVTVGSNVQEGTGILNRSTAAIISLANATDASSGVASSQNITESSLDVTTNSLTGIGVLAVDGGGEAVDGEASNSKIALTGNQQRAVAAGNVGANSLAVTANDVSVFTQTPFSTTIYVNEAGDDPSAEARAGNAIASSQVVDLLDGGTAPTITATVDGTAAGFVVDVEDDVANSSVSNDSNTASALLIGNEVNNVGSISGNSILTGWDDEGEFTPAPGAAGAVASQQIFEANAVATAMAEAGNAVRTLVGDDVEDSTVSTSSNRIEATATGNTGANRLVADANEINTSGNGLGGGATARALGQTGIVYTTGAGFELSSAQSAAGSITATLTDNSDPANVTAAGIATVIVDDVLSSTVTSNSNTLQASATGNEIVPQTNEISVNGTNVATTTALANYQGMTADLSAVIGSPGGEVDVDLATTLSGTVSGGQWSADISGLTSEEQAFWSQYASDNAGVTQSGSTLTFSATGTGDGTPASVTEVYATNTQFVAGAGGVTISPNYYIFDSTLEVNANTTRGTVTGNTATNRIEVSATNLSSGSTLTTSDAVSEGIGQAVAENALANSQDITGSELDTDVAGTFGIVGDLTNYETTDSTLSVSDNQQFATSRGNVVTNSVDLSATNMETGGAISSLQNGGGSDVDAVTVAADSVMDVSAPAAMSGSTLSLDRNRNEAVATVNTATNTLDVAPTNITSISDGANVDLLSSRTILDGLVNTATADFAIANGQTAAGTVAADAISRVVNQDVPEAEVSPFETDGILNSTVTVDGNVTIAQGSANRATNAMTLESGAAFGATGAVLNVQDSATAVTASVNATAGVDLIGTAGVAGDPPTPGASALNSSSSSVSNNAASAQARGNTSTNTLNVSSLSLGAGGAGASVALNGGDVADGGVGASFGTLNSQRNIGSIEATVTGQYGTQFASLDTITDAVFNSQVSVMNNVIQASAIANTATNAVTLSALNHGASTAAIGNEQVNLADVTSVVSNSTIGATNGGSVLSSMMSIGNNAISSSAVGNSAISTLTRN